MFNQRPAWEGFQTLVWHGSKMTQCVAILLEKRS